MTEARKDNNNIATMIGVLNTDGVTPTLWKANQSTHVANVSDGSSGSDLGNDSAYRDKNMITTMLAIDASGNIIPLYVDSSGNLLIKTT